MSVEAVLGHERADAVGVEGDSQRRLGRGLTGEELERVLRRYPGDQFEDERTR
jgi:hypothetical protein